MLILFLLFFHCSIKLGRYLNFRLTHRVLKMLKLLTCLFVLAIEHKEYHAFLPQNAAQKIFKIFIIWPGNITEVRAFLDVKRAKSSDIPVSAVPAVSASVRIPQVEGFFVSPLCDTASTVRPRRIVRNRSAVSNKLTHAICVRTHPN